MSTSFVYDGDGNRVQSAIGGATTTFVGNYYEVTGQSITKYYYAGGSRVAMNAGGTVSYLLSDQLGSTSITADGNGTKIAEQRYKVITLAAPVCASRISGMPPTMPTLTLSVRPK